MKFYLKINNTYFFIFHKEFFKSPSKHQMDVFIKELSYNTKISRLLMNLNLKNKSQILDVGGNIGYYSILFSKIFSKFKPEIYSFEPYPKNINYFYFNTRNYINIHLLPFGLGNEVKIADFNYPQMIDQHENNSGLISVKKILHDSPYSKKNLIFNLDNLNNYFNNISFIKADIEGSEYDFIKGSYKTIERNYPIINIEYNIKLSSLEQINEILLMLNFLNYEAFCFSGKNISRILNKLNSPKNCELFFIQKNDYKNLKIFNTININ